LGPGEKLMAVQNSSRAVISVALIRWKGWGLAGA
jgi:hypothetical protein